MLLVLKQKITENTLWNRAENAFQRCPKGSNLVASDTLAIDTNELNVEAGESTLLNSSSTKGVTGSVGMTIGGGMSYSMGFDTSSDYSSSRSYTNSLLLANNIDIKTKGDTNIKGGTLIANENANVEVGGDLNVESLKNKGVANSNSFSVSLNLAQDKTWNVSSIGGGINYASSNSNTEQILTSGIVAGSLNVSVGRL